MKMANEGHDKVLKKWLNPYQ